MKKIDFDKLDFINDIEQVSADCLANYIFLYNEMVNDNNVLGALSQYNKILGMLNGISCYEYIPDKYFKYIKSR